MRLVPWQPDDLLRRLDDVVAVYGEAMGYRAELLQTRRGYIGAHVRRAGFRAVATLTTDGQLAGFGYGYASGPGQWWHDQVRRRSTTTARQRWLARLLRGRRAARPPERAGPRHRRPAAARAAVDGRRRDRAAVHPGGRRAEVPGLAALPPVRLRRRAARLHLPRRRAGVRRSSAGSCRWRDRAPAEDAPGIVGI